MLGGLAALVAIEAAVAQAQPPDLGPHIADEDDVARLERGELVEREDVEFGGVFGEQAVEEGDSALVLFLVDAPERAVWSVLTSFEAQPEFMPHMTSAKLESRGEAAGTPRVCFAYSVLWVDSTNCFFVERRRETGTLLGVLDAEGSDDRLHGVNYFWRVQPWRDERMLLAYYQKLSYSSPFAAFGHDLFVGAGSTADAVRERVRDVAAGRSPE